MSMSARAIHPVILSGGKGQRLWPLSRALYPKQLLCLHGERSMLQETALRLSGGGFAPPLMVCNEDHRFIIAEQLRQAGCPARGILLEPAARNTAPAATVAALLLAEEDPSALLLVTPSDHVIRRPQAFLEAVAKAAPAAEAGGLVCFGIEPTHPETGYGYIRAGSGSPHAGVAHVASFTEKPDAATAEAWLAEGGYLWNGGMFLFRADTWLAEVGRFAPTVLDVCRLAVAERRSDLDFLRLGDGFAEAPSAAIDTAVMERTDRALVVPVDMDWSDVGAWSALWDIGDRDDAGNLVVGDVVAEDSHNSYLRSQGRLLATLGVENLVVVATDDAVLVADRSRAQDVGKVVARLGALGRSEGTAHLTEHRPWGTFRCLSVGDRYQVKLITVKPGETLSLQMHYHRAEHWIVVVGTAQVTRGEETFLLHENQSTYIPLGETHRLENPGKLPLVLIEVQSGAYLGEDDIVRFQDDYNRKIPV